MIRSLMVRSRNIYVNITTNQTSQFNVHTAAGRPSLRTKVIVTVFPGVILQQGITTVPTSGSWASGSEMVLINRGYIYGTGGGGGSGGSAVVLDTSYSTYFGGIYFGFFFHSPYAGNGGENGGDALVTNIRTEIQNFGDIYAGGGGGGAGPGLSFDSNIPAGYESPLVLKTSYPDLGISPMSGGGGGGGGRGYNNASGGSGGDAFTERSTGSIYAPGVTGNDGSAFGPGQGSPGGISGIFVVGGSGGSGGDWGQSGEFGSLGFIGTSPEGSEFVTQPGQGGRAINRIGAAVNNVFITTPIVGTAEYFVRFKGRDI